MIKIRYFTLKFLKILLKSPLFFSIEKETEGNPGWYNLLPAMGRGFRGELKIFVKIECKIILR
jgi:hypothetical protein